MNQEQATLEDIKHKIRHLKKLEIKIRFTGMGQQNSQNRTQMPIPEQRLVWTEFFDLHETQDKPVKYPLGRLLTMSRDEVQEVVSEYFYHVYFRFYKENGITDFNSFDPDILASMGLPPHADKEAIKKRFRELAKRLHPDVGGNSQEFIVLMENYQRLLQ